MNIYDLIQKQQTIQGSVPILNSKPFIIYVWDVGCEACLAAASYLLSMSQSIPSDRCPILGLCVNTDVEAVQKYIAHYQLAWPQLFDGSGMNSELVAMLKVESIPKVCLFDASGNIVPTELPELIGMLIV